MLDPKCRNPGDSFAEVNGQGAVKHDASPYMTFSNGGDCSRAIRRLEVSLQSQLQREYPQVFFFQNTIEHLTRMQREPQVPSTLNVPDFIPPIPTLPQPIPVPHPGVEAPPPTLPLTVVAPVPPTPPNTPAPPPAPALPNTSTTVNTPNIPNATNPTLHVAAPQILSTSQPPAVDTHVNDENLAPQQRQPVKLEPQDPAGLPRTVFGDHNVQDVPTLMSAIPTSSHTTPAPLPAVTDVLTPLQPPRPVSPSPSSSAACVSDVKEPSSPQKVVKRKRSDEEEREDGPSQVIKSSY